MTGPVEELDPSLAGDLAGDLVADPATVHAEEPDDGRDHASGRQLLRSSAVVAVGTGLSRVTGLARTITQAVVLGKYVGDVYNAANTLPNLLYDLLLGGVLAATLVPVFVETRTREDDDSTGAVLTTLGVALVAVTAVAMLFSPILGRIFTDTATEAELATALLFMFLPQIFFYGMTTLASGLLNANRRFAAAAFAPVLNNIVTIAVLVVFSARIGSSPTVDQLSNNTSLLWLLGIGTTAGIAVQAFALLPAVKRAHVPIRWRFEPRNPAVREVARLSGWTFGYVATNALVIGIVMALAGHENEGPVTAYSYAYQFFQLPYGLLAVAVITAFLPELSQLALDNDMQRFGERFLLALRLTILLIVPAAIGFVLLAAPIVSTMFEYRAFDHDVTMQMADALLAFSIGLPSFALYLLSVRAFYAMKDTKTPFVINLGQSLLLLVLAIALRQSGAAGLALGFALSYVVFGFIAVAVLHQKTGGLPWQGSLGSFTRIGLAAIGCAIAVGVIARFVGADEGVGAWVRTFVGVLFGGALYLGVCAALKVPELRHAKAVIRRGG